MDILALQEIRWPNSGKLKKGNTILFYNKTTNGQQENRVGFMVHDKTLPRCKSFLNFQRQDLLYTHSE